jgi:uncharacterized membrane protein YidH (DUF202 family)
MPDDSTFFAIAAALLPTLMLAGLLSDKLKPPEEKSDAPRWPFWVILFTGCSFVFAEVVAIGAAISGEPEDVERLVVSATLIAAAVGTVLLVLLPWIENVEREKRRAAILPLAGLLVVLAVGAVAVLHKAVENAALFEDQQANEAAWDRLLTEQRSLYAQEARLYREHTRLIVRESDLLTGPRAPDTRGRLFLLRQQIRSVEAQLEDVAREQRRLAQEAEQLNEETERLLWRRPSSPRSSSAWL